MIDWSSSSDEEDLISFDLPPGSQPKVSRPKGQAVEVAVVDPNDVGEDGQIKLFLTSKRKSHNCCDAKGEIKGNANACCLIQRSGARGWD